ncbi:MAG: hypothetical protein NT084_14700, partial [Bacteroidetes bacterium]|nr:hypothetical protein [Bacteroidota bacterium]
EGKIKEGQTVKIKMVKGKETWKEGRLTSQAQVIKKEDMDKHPDDPQDPGQNGGQEPGGQ